MRRVLLPLAAAAAIISAIPLMPDSARAMTAGASTATAIQAAAETSASQYDRVKDGTYVCRHRAYSGRRVCAFVRGAPWRRNQF